MRDQLQDRYRVERELGHGGMATVYLAHDLKHDRPVALKVLLPELSQSLGPDRFLREIRLAARLQHPHILPIHDSGEAGGLLWYTMPYVDGESLRDRLRRGGQLPVDEALRVAGEVADALGYAHGKGVIHRDIKPENILLSNGHALVADFGVARGARGEDEALTATGMAVGTPAYMSPEQAMADPTLDGRSDLYSLGCVLYEMLVGETPYTGSSAQAIVLKRLRDPIPSARRLRETVPTHIDEALHTVLAKVPADRFGTAAEFRRALSLSGAEQTSRALPGSTAVPFKHRGMVLVAVLLLALGLAAGVYLSRGATTGGALPRLAVLPFDNLGDSAHAYFADGMTDAVEDRLAALPGLEVIASNSSAPYRHSTKPPVDIGHDLSAGYLLFGKVRWARGADGVDRIQVRPQLVEASTGLQRWGQAFDASMTDVFQVQGEIAERVASALGVALGTVGKQALTRQPTGNLEAYDILLKTEGSYATAADVGDFAGMRKALVQMREAVRLDSTFGDAWSRLARGYTFLWQVDPEGDDSALAHVAAEQAVRHSPDNPESYLALGGYQEGVKGDFPAALSAYEAGLRLSPNNARLVSSIATVERYTGRWDEALRHARKAQELDPRCACSATTLGTTLHLLGRLPEARQAYQRGRSISPGDLFLVLTEAMTSLAEGHLDSARAVLRRTTRAIDATELAAFVASAEDLFWLLERGQQDTVVRLPPDYPVFGGNRGYWAIVHTEIYHLRGDTALARAWADTARREFDAVLRSRPFFTKADQYALRGLASAYLGRKEEAVRDGRRGVERALEVSDPWDTGYIRDVLARIYVLVGDPAAAVGQLDTIVRTPSFYSRAWFRIDPTLSPLRGHPAFERLVSSR